jgi:hypothetical protein
VYCNDEYLVSKAGSAASTGKQFYIGDLKQKILTVSITKTLGSVTSITINNVTSTEEITQSVSGLIPEDGTIYFYEYFNIWDISVNGVGSWSGTGVRANDDSAWVDTVGSNNFSFIFGNGSVETIYDGVEVVEDSTTGKYYCLFPKPILQLPERGEGVRTISTITGDELEFVPVSEYEYRLMDGMEVEQVETSTVEYLVRFDRVVFVRNLASTVITNGVRMSLVIPFNEYELTDEIPIPSGKGVEFINGVIASLQQIPPVDLSNKNN